MSKDKPEVNDIWQSTRKNKQKIFITHTLGRVYCITEQGVVSSRFWSDFSDKYGSYKYLGKSKANINELFEVE